MLVKEHNWRAGFAQPAAFALVLVAFYVSYDLTIHNHDAAGIAIGTTTIGAIPTAFLGARLTPAKEEQDEKKTPPDAT